MNPEAAKEPWRISLKAAQRLRRGTLIVLPGG